MGDADDSYDFLHLEPSEQLRSGANRGHVDDRWTGLGCCGYWVEPRDDSGQT